MRPPAGSKVEGESPAYHLARQARLELLEPFAVAVLGAAVLQKGPFGVEQLAVLLDAEGMSPTSSRDDVGRFLRRREIYHLVVEALA